jgi:hypothetical protein
MRLAQTAPVPGIGHPDPPSDLCDRQVRVGKQAAGVGHAAFDDPLLPGAPGAAAHDGGSVWRRSMTANTSASSGSPLRRRSPIHVVGQPCEVS